MRFLLILLLLAAPARAAEFAWAPLTPDQAREEVGLVRRAMDHAYPGFGRFAGRSAFDAALDAVAADPPADGRAMYASLARALAVLKDTHLVLEPAAGWRGFAQEAAIFAPWRCDIREGRLYATAVSGGARAAGLAPGDEILAIDGVPAGDYVAAARALVAQDGENDRARDAQLCGRGDFAGSDLDHYSAFLFPAGETQTLEARRGDGAARAVALSRLTFSELVTEFGGVWVSHAGAEDHDLMYLPLSGSASYLRLGSLEQGSDARARLEAAFEDMFLRGTDALILDLRGNGGGSSLMALTLLRYLSAEPVQLVTLAVAGAQTLAPISDIVRASDRRLFTARAGLFAPMAGGGWRAQGPDFAGMLGQHAPLHPGFRGALYVLTDALTDSSAALVAAKLKESGRAVLIGETTGGSAEGPVGGMFAFLPLPHSGHVLHIPLLRQYAQPAEHPELGVAPDYELRPSVADLAEGRDPALAHALALAQAPQVPARPAGPALHTLTAD